MKRAIIIAIIAVLVIAFVVYVIPGAAMWIAFSISGRGPKSPTIYENIGTKWACEEPYIWFEVRDVELGFFGIGELETEDDERIPVRFRMSRGTYEIYPESSFWEIGEDGEQQPVPPATEHCIMHGIYKMNRKGTKVWRGRKTMEHRLRPLHHRDIRC